MTYRLVGTDVIDDIANAVRERNGKSRAYKPGELPQAVRDLDGTNEGNAVVREYEALDQGLVQDSVFKGIANALRFHTLSKRKYKPRNMGAAIRGLVFEEAEKPRALLHDSGVLEFNLYSTRRTDLDTDVAEIYDVSLAGYADADDVPWLEAADAIRQVDIRPSFSMAFIANMSHWFSGCARLEQVHGFDYVANTLSAVDGMFAGCAWLDSIYSTYAVSQRTRMGNPFDGCLKLIGNGLRVAEDSDAGDVLHSGTGGMVMLETDRTRPFFNVNLYAGGTLTFTPFEPTKQYNCISTGRLCGGIAYASHAVMPYAGLESRVKSIQFKSQMKYYAGTPMDWWFAGCNNIRGFTGLENLYSPTSMRHTFDGCDGLARIELIGLDPTALTDVSGAFSGCSTLTTITADPDWQLPQDCIGADVFAGCANLVGGNGTTWDENNTGCDYFAIDTAGTPGYLTTI